MDIRYKWINLIKRVYPGYGLKNSDIILGTFPKSGTTWFRFIYGNMISILELDGRAVDYDMLNNDLNSSFDAHIYPKIKYKKLPRLVATHQAYDGRKFGKNRAIYLTRNPLDTLVSYWEYRKGFKKFNNEFTFKSLIRDEKYGIHAWVDHYLSWSDKADVVISYEDLKKSEVGVMTKIINTFSLDVHDKKIIELAIERSRFDTIRSMEKEKGLDARAKKDLKESFRFARKGKTGEWRSYFDNEDIEYVGNILTRSGLRDIVGDDIDMSV